MSEAQAQLILHRLDELQQDLVEIKELQRRTNGRVTRLELREAQAEGMRAALRAVPVLAACAASLAAVVTAVVTLAGG